MIERLIVFAFTAEEVSNIGDFPFTALIDSKISASEYREIREVDEIRQALRAVGPVPADSGHLDDGVEYGVLASQIALMAGADDVEPIRTALLDVAESRNAHWRRYVSGLGPQGPAQHGSAVPECASEAPSKSNGAA